MNDLEKNEEQNSNEEPEQNTEEKLRTEVQEWKEKYLRKMAEFENFRKRTRQESEIIGQLITESLIVSLLPILDDFDRFLSNITSADDPYRKGIELVHGKLWSFFESRGVKVLEARGKTFNPEEHDAMMMKPTNDFPAGTVLEVVSPGYVIGDKVIRHAKVIVTEPVREAQPTENA